MSYASHYMYMEFHAMDTFILMDLSECMYACCMKKREVFNSYE